MAKKKGNRSGYKHKAKLDKQARKTAGELADITAAAEALAAMGTESVHEAAGGSSSGSSGSSTIIAPNTTQYVADEKAASTSTGSEVNPGPSPIPKPQGSILNPEANAWVPPQEANKNTLPMTHSEAAKRAFAAAGPLGGRLMSPMVMEPWQADGLKLTVRDSCPDMRAFNVAFQGQVDTPAAYTEMAAYSPEEYAGIPQTEREKFFAIFPINATLDPMNGPSTVLQNGYYHVCIPNPGRDESWKVQEIRDERGLLHAPALPDDILQQRIDGYSQWVNRAEHMEDLRLQPDRFDNGAGPVAHNEPTNRPMLERHYTKPLGPGCNRYGDNKVILPNAGGIEWTKISQAVHALNVQTANRQHWEPPIPMGFEARASFNQRGKQKAVDPDTPIGNSPLREDLDNANAGTSASAAEPLGRGCRVAKELDWVRTKFNGCDYCTGFSHKTHECKLLELHRRLGKEQCLSCHQFCNAPVDEKSKIPPSQPHHLRQCPNLPKFHDHHDRAVTLQNYAHTLHWRRILFDQHSKFAGRMAPGQSFPEKLPDDADGTVVFSSLPCPDCRPEHHWGWIRANLELVRFFNSTVEEVPWKHDPYDFWNFAAWLFCTQNCPVLWTVQHHNDPYRQTVIINPLQSPAVDAFWRVVGSCSAS
jgi:hypothetical protein